MANRKRGAVTLPMEFETSEKLTTKKELSLLRPKSLRCCPPAPRIKKRIWLDNGSKGAKPIFFNNSVSLSDNYNSSLPTSYLDQTFTISNLMGKGSFGKVYRVINRESKEVYAAKKINFGVDHVHRYDEIKNYEKVGYHPNIVQFFMAWEEKMDLFILLEFCELSLADFAMLNDDICEDILWNILLDVCKALHHLHNRKLLHLDIKPGNIMMKKGYFKLTDFGILLDLNINFQNKSWISDGDPKYLALEVLEGIYNASCDIFGLGITLLELAANLELPTHGPLWQQLRHQILPVSFYQKMSLGFQIIIERMLKADHNKRPSAETLLKYKSVKDVERKDKKTPRIDYGKEFVHFNGYNDISMEFPGFFANNNNNDTDASTPPYAASKASDVFTPEHYIIEEMSKTPSEHFLNCNNTDASTPPYAASKASDVISPERYIIEEMSETPPFSSRRKILFEDFDLITNFSSSESLNKNQNILDDNLNNFPDICDIANEINERDKSAQSSRVDSGKMVTSSPVKLPRYRLSFD